jgi:hypothetical protein
VVTGGTPCSCSAASPPGANFWTFPICQDPARWKRAQASATPTDQSKNPRKLAGKGKNGKRGREGREGDPSTDELPESLPVTPSPEGRKRRV